MGTLDLLRSEPAFRRLWLGQVVSQCGDWLQFVALLKLFPTEGSGALALSGLFIIRMLPWIVWAPIAGVVADRFPRGRIMVLADLMRAVVVLGYLFVESAADVWLIYAILFTQESLTAFFEPARQAAVPQIVPRKALLSANALSGATWSAMLAVGSALGGVIAVYVGSKAAFVADSATFIVSAMLIRSVAIPNVVTSDKPKRDRFGLSALREGARYLRSHGPQASATLIKGLWGMSTGFVFLVSIYAGQRFTPQGGDPAAATGILYTGRGLGALIGPLAMNAVVGNSVRGLRVGVQLAFPLAAVTLALLPFAPNVWVAALLLLFATAGGSIAWVSSTQLMQLTVPNALQGRVFSVDLAALTLTMSLSSGLAGVVLSRELASLSQATYGMAGAAVVSTLLWAMAMKRFGTRLDEAASGDSS